MEEKEFDFYSIRSITYEALEKNEWVRAVYSLITKRAGQGEFSVLIEAIDLPELQDEYNRTRLKDLLEAKSFKVTDIPGADHQLLVSWKE